MRGAALVLTACAGAPPAAEVPRGLDVVALSQPAWWLTEQVGGGRVHARLLPPPGEDPPQWTPAPEAIAALRGVDLIVMAGAGYEAWTAMATLPDDRQFAMAEGIEPIRLAGVTHAHGDKPAHAHAGIDPHVWTDPTQVAAAARRLAERLTALDPAGAEAFARGAEAVARAAGGVDVELASVTQPLHGRSLAANHPSFNYLARRYHLDLTTIDLDPAAAPAAPQRQALATWAVSATAPALLWEAPPSEAARAAVPAGVIQVVLDPAEQPGPDGRYDWTAAMQRTAVALAGAAR